MKILLISNMYPSKENPSYGVFVKNFKDQMEKQDFDVTQTALICGRGKNKFEKIIKYIKFFRDVIFSIKQDKYDLIYVHYIGHSLLPILLVQKYIKKSLVINAHGSDVFVNNKTGKHIQNLVTPIIKKANTIVVPSSYFKDVIHNKFHIENNKIFVSPSGGIDTNLFSPLSIKKNNDLFIIGYVSRIDEGKGWDVLLHAIKLLLNKGIINFKVLMIGGGSQEQLLLKMIEALNIEKYVDFIGRVPHEELVHYYNKMDVFAFTTTRLAESLGLVGLEAMACGVPVIGSNIGGLKEYIISGYNGELFEQGNAYELSEYLKTVYNLNEASRKVYKQNSLKTAYQYNSFDVNQRLKQKIGELI